MGQHPNIDYNKFPVQGKYLGKRVKVSFNYSQKVERGTIIRDDIDNPFLTLIQLDNGGVVSSKECQYTPLDVDPEGFNTENANVMVTAAVITFLAICTLIGTVIYFGSAWNFLAKG